MRAGRAQFPHWSWRAARPLFCFRPRLLSPFAKPSYKSHSFQRFLSGFSICDRYHSSHLNSINNHQVLNLPSFFHINHIFLACSVTWTRSSGDCNFFKRNNSRALWDNYLSQPTQQLFSLAGLISPGLASSLKETFDLF